MSETIRGRTGKKVIYVAMAYRGKTVFDVHCNIHLAWLAAAEIWALGAVALCPHTNSQHMTGLVDDQVFLDGDIDLMLRCDAVYMGPGWQRSAGAVHERQVAADHGLAVFEDLEALGRFCRAPVAAAAAVEGAGLGAGR